MMVNSISNVSFRADGTIDLSRPGKYSNPEAQTTTAPDTASKKSSATKKVVGTIATIAIIVGALAALPKLFPNAIKVLNPEELQAATGFFGKAKAYTTHYIAKAGTAICDAGVKCWNGIKGIFKKAPKAAEAVQE